MIMSFMRMPCSKNNNNTHHTTYSHTDTSTQMHTHTHTHTHTDRYIVTYDSRISAHFIFGNVFHDFVLDFIGCLSSFAFAGGKKLCCFFCLILFLLLLLLLLLLVLQVFFYFFFVQFATHFAFRQCPSPFYFIYLCPFGPFACFHLIGNCLK